MHNKIGNYAMMQDIVLRKCPMCGEEIKLYANISRVPQCFARCNNCGKEYDLPTVKLKVLKNLKISKTTLHDAEIAWNDKKYGGDV